MSMLRRIDRPHSLLAPIATALLLALASATFAAAPRDLMRGGPAFRSAAPTAAADAAPAFRGCGNPNPDILPPQGMPFGKSYGGWAAAWWVWDYSIPFATNPILDPTGEDQSQKQSGPVWFLAGDAGGAVERTVQIPVGRAIFVPLINVANDYPCPDPTFQPAPGQSLADFLTQGAEAIIANVDGLSAELDGRTLVDLFDYKGLSRLSTLTGDLSMQAFDGCITGTPQPFVADGYWLMIHPLTPGAHTLHLTSSAYGGGFTLDVLYHLQITTGRRDSQTVDLVPWTPAPARAGESWGRLKLIYR